MIKKFEKIREIRDRLNIPEIGIHKEAWEGPSVLIYLPKEDCAQIEQLTGRTAKYLEDDYDFVLKSIKDKNPEKYQKRTPESLYLSDENVKFIFTDKIADSGFIINSTVKDIVEIRNTFWETGAESMFINDDVFRIFIPWDKIEKFEEIFEVKLGEAKVNEMLFSRKFERRATRGEYEIISFKESTWEEKKEQLRKKEEI